MPSILDLIFISFSVIPINIGFIKSFEYAKFRDCMNWYFENGYIIDFDREKYNQNTFQYKAKPRSCVLVKCWLKLLLLGS